MQVTLKLVPANASQSRREAVAWFVPGCDASAWMRELNRWDIPLETILLRPIPCSLDETTSLGVLVTFGKSNSDDRTASKLNPQLTQQGRGTPQGKGTAYGRVSHRLFVPVDGSICPDVSEDDLMMLLPSDDSEFVWHPSVGFVRIEATERLRITDLLTSPLERKSDWSRAVPGLSFRSRLISVETEILLDVEEVIKRAGDDIGQQATNPDQLPPTPDEWFGGKLNQWTKPLRDAMKRHPKPPPDQGQTPPSGSSSTSGTGTIGSTAGAILAGGLAAMALPLVAAVAAAGSLLKGMGMQSIVDQVARNREIDRLLHLLASDPDHGLRFALPIAGSGDHRGTANPSNQLGTHDTRFQLNGHGGGGPVDQWDLTMDQQLKLIHHYRELATREIRLGRHRRAAYIFAELMSDFISAAATLESGGHYREAAVLYRDRLKRPKEAARCLERAGLLDDAALLYLELDMVEVAAELYLRLDRRDEAERLLREYVQKLIGNGDYLNACRILHDKLQDVDGALIALDKGWPTSPSARACLERSFTILGQHSMHEEAHRRVEALRADSCLGPLTSTAAVVLSQVAGNYPESRVRAIASDTTQVFVAGALTKSTPRETKDLLDLIWHLAPHDRLLTRDCDRYVRLRQQATSIKKPRIPKTRGIKLVHTDSLKLTIDWRIAKSTESSVYIAGYFHRSLVLQRLEWNQLGNVAARVFWPGVSDQATLILDPHPQDQGPAILHQIGTDSLVPRRFTAGQEKWSLPGSPSWATTTTVAMAYNFGGRGWRVQTVFESLELVHINPLGDSTFIKDLKISFRDHDIGTVPISLFASTHMVRIGIGSHLCRPQLTPDTNQPGDSESDLEPLPAIIQSLTGYQSDPAGGSMWLLATFETGCLLLDEVNGNRFPIATELHSPTATFLKGGQFAVAGTGEVHAFEIVDSKPVQIGAAIIDFAPISVTTTDKISEFAVFGRNGEIQIFSIEH